MKKYKIVLLSGDGIGPEISEVSKKVLKKLSKNHNFDIEIIEKLFGGIAYEKYGNPAPDETLDQCKKCDAVLLACVGDIKYDSLARELRPESGLLKLRSALNLFANIRPVKIRKSLLDASTLKKEIVDKKRINFILKKIKAKSLKQGIDPKITNRIWKNMIWSYIDYERRNFKKK